MRLATFRKRGELGARPGIVVGDTIYDAATVAPAAQLLPPSCVIDMLGALDGWRRAAAALAAHPRRSVEAIPLAGVTLLPPVPRPGKVLCVGKNNRRHLDELARNELLHERPQEPTGFIKVAACLVGDNAAVVRPAGIATLDYEPELAVVIGRTAAGVTRDRALDHVAGVTLFNDLTAREIQKREVAAGTRFWTAKNMPGFGPLGPVLVTLDELGGDPHDLTLVCRVNGEERIRYRLRDQLYGIGEVVEHFSRYVPFEAGDVITLGAPAGSAIGQDEPEKFYLVPGDVVEVACDAIGVLATRIVAPA